jgi:hypothetical protein
LPPYSGPPPHRKESNIAATMDVPTPDDAPRWSLVLDNESVRKLRALYMDLPESQRGAYLALTAALPPPILGDSSSSKLAFMRFEDILMQRKQVPLAELARAARAADTAAEAAGTAAEAAAEAACPLSARLGRCWTDAELKAWGDRFEAGCRALGVEPRLRMYV